MSKQSGRSAGRLAFRSIANKTRKVTIGLQPDLADRLRLAAVALGLDQGDLVTAGLAEVLRSVRVTVSVSSPGSSSVSDEEEPRDEGPKLLAV